MYSDRIHTHVFLHTGFTVVTTELLIIYDRSTIVLKGGFIAFFVSMS